MYFLFLLSLDAFFAGFYFHQFMIALERQDRLASKIFNFGMMLLSSLATIVAVLFFPWGEL